MQNMWDTAAHRPKDQSMSTAMRQGHTRRHYGHKTMPGRGKESFGDSPGTSHSFPGLRGGIHDELELQGPEDVGLLTTPSALLYLPRPYCLDKASKLYKASKVHCSLYFSIFQMALKTSGAI